MTEFEALEIAALMTSNAISSYTIYISFTFAYLTVAYLVGAKLSKIQALVASSLYLFAALSAILAFFANLEVYGMAISQAPLVRSLAPYLSPTFWKVYMLGLMSTGLLVSLFFMWDVRRQKKR